MTGTCEDSDDEPQLSAYALAALNEFLNERKEQEAADAVATSDAGLNHVSEDWQLSQFWYTDETAAALAREALDRVGHSGKIACVSCPSLYKALMDSKPGPNVQVVVLEFDRRFAKWGDDFVFYDFKESEVPELPEELRRSFDLVVCDPPFLNEDCIARTLRTAVETLGKAGTDTPIMFCTGQVMEEFLIKLSEGKLKKSMFEPRHTSKLSNPFILSTNFETKTFG